MIINGLMTIMIFNIISYPCEVTDVISDVKFDVKMLSVIGIIVRDTPTITLEFVVGVAYAVDVVTDLLAVIFVDVLSVIMSVDENVNGLAAVMTPLDFTLPAPS